MPDRAIGGMLCTKLQSDKGTESMKLALKIHYSDFGF